MYLNLSDTEKKGERERETKMHKKEHWLKIELNAHLKKSKEEMENSK
jgi:hypothetical protein